jgi:hypothetical protein
MIMTRFYIASPMPYLSGLCRVCHRRPNIGWVYRCTEEDGGFLPASDFAIPEEHLITARTRDDDSINHFSPVVARAIKEDQYTEEQIKILIEQKRGVRNAVLAHVGRTRAKRANTPSTSLDRSSDSSTSEENTTFSTLSSFTLDEELQLSLDTKPNTKEPARSCFTETITAGSVGSVLDASQPLQGNQRFSSCSYKVCPACRPAYQDRAIQRLNAIVDNHYEMPPPWELGNRRISDARIVAQIGLPKQPRSRSKPDVSSQEDSNNAVPSESLIESEPGADLQLKQSRTGLRSGFRLTVCKAFNHVKQSRSRSNSHLTLIPSEESNLNHDYFQRFSPSMLFMRQKSRIFGNEYAGRFINDIQLQDSLMLMLAINTPLPDTAKDLEDNEGFEVQAEAEDNIALTEERLGLSAADIIMLACTGRRVKDRRQVQYDRRNELLGGDTSSRDSEPCVLLV